MHPGSQCDLCSQTNRKTFRLANIYFHKHLPSLTNQCKFKLNSIQSKSHNQHNINYELCMELFVNFFSVNCCYSIARRRSLNVLNCHESKISECNITIVTYHYLFRQINTSLGHLVPSQINRKPPRPINTNFDKLERIQSRSV